MEKPRIIFMGTPDFACGILDTLVQMNQNVVAVVSQPDKRIGRKQVIQKTPVKLRAESYGIPVVQPFNIKVDYQEVLEYKPDLIVTCAYGQIVPEAILNFPKYKCINVHASLLPRYRGGAPIHWAVINGEEETGITIMYMAKKMDAGDILSQSSVQIDCEDTTSDMYNKLEVVGKKLLEETLPKLISGQIVSTVQDESLVTYAWNITKEQEFISFNRPVKDVYNHIRGLISWPVGYGIVEGKKIKFHKISMEETSSQDYPGKIIELCDKGLSVACPDGFIFISELQVEGKTKTNAKEFYNGLGQKLIGKNFE